ncbi:MAG: hypothetical protein VZS44_00645 [Bacilli bacterium]|nr:hypothetical protein [Bacilli bacterium]
MTLEEKEKFIKENEKWIKDYIDEINETREKTRQMMSNTNYIEWLYKYTEDKESFSDIDLLYIKINSNNKENAEALNLFYNGIKEYAEQNYIYPMPCNYGHYYKVKLDNHDYGFAIGIQIGQGSLYFCNRIPVNKDKDFISFNDIMNNKKQPNVDHINRSLNSFARTIIDLDKKGIPIEAINDTYNKTINDLTSNNTNIKKRVKKKDEASNE